MYLPNTCIAYSWEAATNPHSTYLFRPLTLKRNAHTNTAEGKKKPPSVADKTRKGNKEGRKEGKERKEGEKERKGKKKRRREKKKEQGKGKKEMEEEKRREGKKK